jgi:hypothetical protein
VETTCLLDLLIDSTAVVVDYTLGWIEKMETQGERQLFTVSCPLPFYFFSVVMMM